jgi:hypothetical protein
MSHTLFRIQNCLSSLYLSTQTGIYPGTDIIQSTEEAGKNQEWFLKLFPSVGAGAAAYPEYFSPGFQIISVASDAQFSIGVPDNSVAPEPVQLLDLGPKGPTPLNQLLWLPLPATIPSPSGFNLINVQTGLVLDVPMHVDGGDGGMAPGLTLQQYPKNTGLNQQWSFVSSPGHTYPKVTITPKAGPQQSGTPNSVIEITGTDFDDYVGQDLSLLFFGVPANADYLMTSPLPLGRLTWANNSNLRAPVTATVQPDNGFWVTVPITFAYPVFQGVNTSVAQSNWVSCYVLLAQTNNLLAISYIQIEYFYPIFQGY